MMWTYEDYDRDNDKLSDEKKKKAEEMRRQSLETFKEITEKETSQRL